MMALTPIYQGDTILIQLEREQKLREWIERRREELMLEHEGTVRKLDESGVKLNDGNSSRCGNSGGGN